MSKKVFPLVWLTLGLMSRLFWWPAFEKSYFQTAMFYRHALLAHYKFEAVLGSPFWNSRKSSLLKHDTCEQHLEAPSIGKGWLEGQLVASGSFEETNLSTVPVIPHGNIFVNLHFPVCLKKTTIFFKKNAEKHCFLECFFQESKTNLENPLLTVVPKVTTPCLTPAPTNGASSAKPQRRWKSIPPLY